MDDYSKKMITLLNAMGKAARIGGWAFNMETGEGIWTEELYRIFELPIGQKPAIEDSILFYQKEDQETIKEAYRKAIEHGEPYDLELRFITAKKNHLWVRTICRPEIENGKVKSLMGVFQDISDRKKAEFKLRKSEERYRKLFDMESDAIFVIEDETGGIVEVNQAASHIYGYSRDDFLKMRNVDVLAEPDATLRATESALGNVPVRYHKKKNGEIFPVEIMTTHFKWQDCNVHLAAIRDISVRFKAEQERLELWNRFQQAQKMEAVGTLAGGVAHDLNNILSGIVSYPALLLMDIPDGSPLKKPLLTIKKSGEKAAAIVNDLLTLARRGVKIETIVNLREVVNEYLAGPEYEQLRYDYPEVTVETEFGDGLLSVKGSIIHLSKTVMNLVSNAAEAMPDGGCIHILIENRYVDCPIGSYEKITEGDYVALTVSDTGVGIEAGDLERIFEPFYTKKKMGKSGTGLGMAVVWGTVKDHKGYIDVQSKPGEGTRFTIYLPANRTKSDTIEKQDLTCELFMGEGQFVLIVDDVEEQREIATSMVEKLGYHSEAVSSGEAAIEYLKNNKVDIMVLDMIMEPGINGLETYRRACKIRPDLKVIIASGYTKTKHVREAQRLGAGAYIKKPYTLKTLAKAIRKELSS